MSEGEPVASHPLLASAVIQSSGVDPAPGDDQLWVDCPVCHRHQSLAEASTEPAMDPQDITAYRCADGCAVMLVTGHPNPLPMPGSGRYRLGDYAIAPTGREGVLIHMPSGRDVRLTPSPTTPGGGT